MNLIDEWRQAWRFFTVIGAAALAAANVVHANSDVLGVLFPAKTWSWINVLCLVLIAVGRVLKQQIPAPAATAPADPASKESP